MINLAGNKECDRTIRDELTRAGIEIVDVPKDFKSEVPATIMGGLSEYKFERAWYYWIVSGPVPLEMAKKLYEHPEGRKNIRVGGHCGWPAPTKNGLYWDDDEGNRLQKNEHLPEIAELSKQTEEEFVREELAAGIRYVEDPAEKGNGFIEK